jgi:hypothetical protein
MKRIFAGQSQPRRADLRIPFGTGLRRKGSSGVETEPCSVVVSNIHGWIFPEWIGTRAAFAFIGAAF